MSRYEKHITERNTIVAKTPEGRTIEYRVLPDGGAKPITLIEPTGQVYFEYDLDKAKHEERQVGTRQTTASGWFYPPDINPDE